MKEKAKRLSLLAMIAILAFVVAACNSNSNQPANNGNTGASENSGQQGADGKDSVVIATNANFLTLDPHNTSDTNSITAARTMYEGLVGFDENMNVVTVLAEDYDISDDGLVYTFTLKEGVQFHDGTDFNAEAVKVNLDRVLDEENNVRMRRNFTKIESVETPDEKTVVITLIEPYNAFLNKMAMLLIVSPKALEEGANLSQGALAGTGPYQLVEWVQGDRLDLVKNESYWQEGLPKVSKVSFRPVPENGSRVAMLQTGEADFIYPMPTEQVPQVEGDANIVIDTIDSTIVRYVTLNTMKEPFNDLRVRQAMNYAIDKEAFIKVVKSGLGTKLTSSMSSKTQYYSEQTGYDYDPDLAKQLLAEAGYPDGFSVELWGENDSETVRGMQFIQQQLAQIGVDVEVKSMEGATLSDLINSPQSPEEATIQMWYVSWSPSSGDADGATRSLFGSAYWPPNGSNTAYYKNDNVDQWIEDANTTIDMDEAAAIYADIQAQIWEDAPWMFMGVDQIISGKRANVDGIKVYPDGSINLTAAEITQ